MKIQSNTVELLFCSFCLRRWSAVLETLISHGTLVGEGKDKDMFDGKPKEVCFISITLCRGVSSVWHKIEFKKRTKPLGLFLSTKLYIYSISSPAPAIANYISRPEKNM